MRKLLPHFIGLCIALWFGGLVSLFMFVSVFFRQDRGLAVTAAPMMFNVFERYQLMLAAILLACTVVWRLYACSKPKRMLMACLLGASVLAVAEYAVITPRINALRLDGQATSEQFRQLHGYAMWLYTGTTVLTMLAGMAFIASVRSESELPVAKRQTAPEAASA